MRSLLDLESRMTSLPSTERSVSNSRERRRNSSWTFHSDEGNLEIPRPLPLGAVSYPGLENIWEVTEAVGEFQEGQLMQQKERTTPACSSIFAFFPSLEDAVFPDNIWKAKLWLPRIMDKNSS